MAATWTEAARERFLRLIGLDGKQSFFLDGAVYAPAENGWHVNSPQGARMQGRLFREMHVFNKKVSAPTGRIVLSEWQLRCNYLTLAFHVTEAERHIADDISRRSFLTTEARNALEEIWASCMAREREAAHARR